MTYPSFREDAATLVLLQATAKRTTPNDVILDPDGGTLILDPVSTADLELHTADAALLPDRVYLLKFIGNAATDIAYVRMGEWAAGVYPAGDEADANDFPLQDGESVQLRTPDDGSTHHAFSCLFPNIAAATRLHIQLVSYVADDDV